MYVRELVLSYRPKLCEGLDYVGRHVSNPRESAVILAGLLGHEATEVFGVLCLSAKNHLLAYREVGRGSLTTVPISPAVVYQAALLANAQAVIVAHNHPSGDPTPSPDDREATRRLQAAGVVMNIDLLDHVIVGHDGRYFSFREMGVM